ncbi:MAG: hypothetical protein Q9166_007232 [cf. Caloplaca sp. 2 TL-2023]
MFSRIVVLFTLAASAVAQGDSTTTPQPSTTAALQTFLHISNLDASQAADLSTRFDADKASYYGELMSDPSYMSARGVAATGIPPTALAAASADPELFLASLALASSGDLPDWFSALPTPVQGIYKSVGSRDIELYTSEVAVVRPVSSDVAASLSSLSSSIEASASASVEAASSEAVQKGEAPSSPVTNGHMAVVAGGVALAAGLVGIALL